MTNEAIAEVFSRLAFLWDLQGENPFKIRAFQKAEEIISELPERAEALLAKGELTKVPGIGKGSLAVIQELVETGRVQELEELLEKFPASIFELRDVRGLGPKKIKSLYTELGISGVAELEYACQENRLVDLKGFGEKTQAGILKSIADIKFNRGKVLLPVALHEASEVEAHLAKLKGVKAVHRVGALGRIAEVYEELDFLLETDSAQAIDTAKLGSSLRINIHTPKKNESLQAAKFRLTGSPKFLEKFHDEKYYQLPPELLDDAFDPSLAKASLIEERDIRGVFHAHSTASDGANSLEEMVQGCIARGLEYLGISDHSKSAFYARGLEEARIEEQRKEIARLREKYPDFTIFHGIESDILADGSLDYPDKVLAKFDFVIASVHGGMRMSEEQMTKRLVKALENPYTTWIGHLTGRLLLGRSAYAFDWSALVRAAEKTGAGFELNANPYRLDVDWRHLPELRKKKIPVGIFPDAHSIGGFDDLQYGVLMARKGGMTAKDVSNTMNAKEMAKWLSNRKQR